MRLVASPFQRTASFVDRGISRGSQELFKFSAILERKGAKVKGQKSKGTEKRDWGDFNNQNYIFCTRKHSPKN